MRSGPQKNHRAGCAFVHLSRELSASALRLHPTALRSGFDLLALRARCKSKPSGACPVGQGLTERAARNLRRLLFEHAELALHVTCSKGKKFTEPVALSSVSPGNFWPSALRLLPTALRSDFDLLAPRARCKGKPTRLELARQEGKAGEKRALCGCNLGKSCGFLMSSSLQRPNDAGTRGRRRARCGTGGARRSRSCERGRGHSAARTSASFP
jgi:hypothetical protein